MRILNSKIVHTYQNKVGIVSYPTFLEEFRDQTLELSQLQWTALDFEANAQIPFHNIPIVGFLAVYKSSQFGFSEASILSTEQRDFLIRSFIEYTSCACSNLYCPGNPREAYSPTRGSVCPFRSPVLELQPGISCLNSFQHNRLTYNGRPPRIIFIFCPAFGFPSERLERCDFIRLRRYFLSKFRSPAIVLDNHLNKM